MKKRKSLPPADSASDWTKKDLDMLNIHVLPTSPTQMLGCGKDVHVPLTALTSRATTILEECKILDQPHAIDHISIGVRLGANPADDPNTRSGIGWVLLKYLSLIKGSKRMRLESVVDDFLIHLLVALGYNDGDLVVLSVLSTSPIPMVD